MVEPVGAHRGGSAPTPDTATLADRIEAHERWVSTKGKEGQRADLSGLDLSGVELNQVDLREANLEGVILTGAKLRGANFSKALLMRANLERTDLRDADFSHARMNGIDLSGASLEQAQFRGARLRDADLRNIDLSTAVGLLPSQLGGTLLVGSKLPPSVASFDGLANVTEASKTTQSLFTTILLVCAYTWLTIASTTDSQLLNKAATSSSRLPILGVDIPLIRFYIYAPLLLAGFYIYAHLNLQRLWEELADLPAMFPDGRPLDRKAYPWMMNGLVREHAPRLRANRSPLGRWQTRMSTLLAWGMVPATIVVMWARYLRVHEWFVTGTHIVLISICAGMGFGFLRLAASTLKGSERRPNLWSQAWRQARGLTLAVGLGTAFVLWFLSFGVIEGVNPNVVWSEDVGQKLCQQYYRIDPRRWTPWLLEAIGFTPSALLDDAALSTKPANWSPEKPDFNAVRGADLEYRNLRFARAYNAFLAAAYLQEADLRWGDFRESDLRKADLRRTNLAGANFRDAHLDQADLRKAQGAEPRFYAAELNRAKFKDAVLPGANFDQADLRGADLSGASLPGAILTRSQLQPYASDPTQQPRPSSLAGANLEGANLEGANLTGADLTKANLRNANFTGAILANVKGLAEADLEGATGITREQLEAQPSDPGAQALSTPPKNAANAGLALSNP
jgi:uncharacterized protein YjbI with pentapeptide repeats